MSRRRRSLKDRLVKIVNKSPWIILLTAFLALVGGTVGLIVDLPQLVAMLGGIPLSWRKGIFAALAALGWFSALFVCLRRRPGEHRRLRDFFKTPAYYGKMQRGVALAALIIIPLLFAINPIYRAIPPRRTIVLVANFLGPEGSDEYGVTDHVLKQLRDELANEPTMEIRHLDEFITVGQGSEYARRMGDDNKATIVVWGRYVVTPDMVKVWAEFEMLREATNRLPIGTTEQIANVAQLNSFQVQTELAERMTAFVAFVKALLLFDQDRNLEAHTFFAIAQEQWPEAVDAATDLALEFYTGTNLWLLGWANQSLSHLSHAEALLQFEGDLCLKAAVFVNTGLTYTSLGQLDLAIEYYQQALHVYRNIGDLRGQGACLVNLATSYLYLGRAEMTIEYSEQALTVSREIGSLWGEGLALGNLGLAHAALGQVEQAIRYYEQSLAIARRIGDQRGEGNRLNNLGLVYRHLGQIEKAIEHHQQALAIAREIGDQHGESNRLGNLGSAYFQLGQMKTAAEYYQQALAIVREVGDRRNEGTWLGNLGNVSFKLGQVKQAIEYYEQALAISREIGDRQNEGNQLGNLGQVYKRLGQPEKARELWLETLRIFEEIKSPQAETVRGWLEEIANDQ